MKRAAQRGYGTRIIEENHLEPIPFEFKEPKTLIYFTCPEGTSICPRSGFPDFWTAHIWYCPKDFIVELKSFKLYLNSYRNRAVYHEELPHLLLRDLQSVLKADYFKIVVDYTRRGNIQTDVAVEFRSANFKGPEAPTWPIRHGLR